MKNYLKREKSMEKKESKIKYIFKYFLFVIKLTFWISIIILSFGFALLLMSEDVEDEYFDGIGYSWDTNYEIGDKKE